MIFFPHESLSSLYPLLHLAHLPTHSLPPHVAVNILGLDKTSLHFQHFASTESIQYHSLSSTINSTRKQKKETDCLDRVDRKYLVGLGFGLGSLIEFRLIMGI
jgi:hypothetical protein